MRTLTAIQIVRITSDYLNLAFITNELDTMSIIIDRSVNIQINSKHNLFFREIYILLLDV